MPPFKAGLSNPPFDTTQGADKTFPISMPSAKFAQAPVSPPHVPREEGPRRDLALPTLHLPPGPSQPVAWAECLWWRAISVPLWGWLVLATSGAEQPLWDETLPQTPASLEHCLSLLVAERSGGSLERVGRPRSGRKMAGPVSTFLGRTGSGPESCMSQSPCTYYLTGTVPGTGDPTENKAD